MKRTLITLVILVIASLSLFPQIMNIPAKTTIEQDLAMTSYSKDPDAEAVVVFDYGDAFFLDVGDSYRIRFTRVKRIRVFTRDGVKYATESIPIYHNDTESEQVREINATSYNLVNGVVVKKSLDNSSVYTEKINERWNVKKFVVPDVREGTVFEIKYVVESPFLFNMPDWDFQSTIPTISSIYVARMIPFYSYTYIIQGTNRLDIFKQEEGEMERSSSYLPSQPYGSKGYKDMIYTFGMNDVPAFRDEEFISSPEDYILKLDLQLAAVHHSNGSVVNIMTTWPDMTKELLKDEDLGLFIKKCKGPAASIYEKLKNDLPADTIGQYRMLTEYVKNNFIWNSKSDKFASDNPKNLIEKKTGNSAEINMLLIALLRAGGIDANPVILSTRNHGKIKTDYPFESFFNYLIAAVKINNRIFLSDATEPLLAFNQIPPRCINEKGMLLDKEGPIWLDLSEVKLSIDYKGFIITVDPENSLCNVELVINPTKLIAYDYKSELKDDKTLIEEKMKKKGFNTVTEVESENYNELSKPYTIKVKGTAQIDMLPDQISLYPFLNFPFKENPLKQPARTYPVDMVYPQSFVFNSTIKIPQGYKPIDIPEAYLNDNNMVYISLNYQVTDTDVIVTGNYTFKKSVYGTSEYIRIKSYITKITDLFNRPVVFEKL